MHHRKGSCQQCDFWGGCGWVGRALGAVPARAAPPCPVEHSPTTRGPSTQPAAHRSPPMCLPRARPCRQVLENLQGKIGRHGLDTALSGLHELTPEVGGREAGGRRWTQGAWTTTPSPPHRAVRLQLLPPRQPCRPLPRPASCRRTGSA